MNRTVILGGSGFVGTALANSLSAAGDQVTVLCRNPQSRRSVGAIAGVRVRALDVYDEKALATALQGADVLVNLVGILNEKGRDGRGFERAHVTLLEGALRACRAAGVPRLVQMSALNAGQGMSHYLRSKGRAEQLVKTCKLRWAIVRPSVIFGPEDSFLNRFADLLRLTPVLPLACPDSRFQPVYVGDVAAAMVRLSRPNAPSGQTLALVGPNRYSLRELVQYVARLTDRRRLIIGLPDGLARLQASIMDFVPGKQFSTDNYKSLQLDSVSDENGLASLGIEPTPLEAIAPRYLTARHRFHAARSRAGR